MKLVELKEGDRARIVRVSGEEAVLLLDRYARPVAVVLARACQRIEERRLAAVRVARERNLHRTRSRLLPVVNFIRHS